MGGRYGTIETRSTSPGLCFCSSAVERFFQSLNDVLLLLRTYSPASSQSSVDPSGTAGRGAVPHCPVEIHERLESGGSVPFFDHLGHSSTACRKRARSRLRTSVRTEPYACSSGEILPIGIYFMHNISLSQKRNREKASKKSGCCRTRFLKDQRVAKNRSRRSKHWRSSSSA